MTTRQVIEKTVRLEWGYLYACIVKWSNDFDLAEDVLQDALIEALEHWQLNGVPGSPRAWLLKTAKRKALDRIRRQRNFLGKLQQLAILDEIDSQRPVEDDNMVTARFDDHRLGLIFTCCHPALSESAQVALTLRTLGGLNTSEIASAFLVPESTMAQRLVRAKAKIRKANIPYRIPQLDQWPQRLDAVLAVIYLIFNEGYYTRQSNSLVRADLCEEALSLCITLNALVPDSPEVMGLLALMLLHDARRSARRDDDGHYVSLEFQDRKLWSRNKADTGNFWLKKALGMGRPGVYQIQAAISALHTEAASFAETDWRQIWLLYRTLRQFDPSPVIELNAAVALSHYRDAAKGLSALNELAERHDLSQYQPFHAAKADMKRRDGQWQAAIDSYREAIRLSGNPVEAEFLKRRRMELKERLL